MTIASPCAHPGPNTEDLETLPQLLALLAPCVHKVNGAEPLVWKEPGLREASVFAQGHSFKYG